MGPMPSQGHIKVKGQYPFFMFEHREVQPYNVKITLWDQGHLKVKGQYLFSHLSLPKRMPILAP